MGWMPQPKDKDWLNGHKNKTPYISCLQETHLQPRDTYRLKVKGWKNIFHANGDQKKIGVAKLIWDNINFESDNSTIIVADFSNQLTLMDKSTKQKINKEAQSLNDIWNS